MSTKLTVIVDNIPHGGMRSEWGLSILAEYKDKYLSKISNVMTVLVTKLVTGRGMKMRGSSFLTGFVGPLSIVRSHSRMALVTAPQNRLSLLKKQESSEDGSFFSVLWYIKN